MRAIDIIEKKKRAQELSKDEIAFFIQGYTAGRIPDYQTAAFLMAAFLNGLTMRETADLTLEMAASGEMLDLSGVNGVTADKHSTGGVADTTTFLVAPVCAALGVKMAKMSGRGLSFTGGTLDKLESIDGLSVDLSPKAFLRQVNEIGLAVAGQTGELCPADKKLYALRDATGTVDSMPLIASSIMSKKLAAGAQVIVLDVKTGSGAFMQNYEDSLALARVMVDIGTHAGRKVAALITDMDQPLGRAVGNLLEVKEALEILGGADGGDLLKVALSLSARIVYLAGKAPSIEAAYGMASECIRNGDGKKKFLQMVTAQGGRTETLEDFNTFCKTKFIHEFLAWENGYVSRIDARRVGYAAQLLGAGREKKEDDIDLKVGIWLNKRVNDRVNTGESLMTVYANDEAKLTAALRELRSAVHISENTVPARLLIAGEVIK